MINLKTCPVKLIVNLKLKDNQYSSISSMFTFNYSNFSLIMLISILEKK